MSHPPRDGILYTPVDSDSESELGTPSSMDECGTELAAAQRLSYHVRRARRHRPLLVTAFGGVLCFSLLLLTSFGAYTHLLSVARVQIYHPVDSVPGEGVAYGEGVALDDDDTHVLVPVRPLGLPPRLLTAPDRPPVDLLVDLYLHGVATSTDPSLHRPSQIDIVYLFVNASSPYFAAAKAAKAVEEGLGWISGDQKRYRDNGELRGAMRSGALALGDRVRRVHLLSGSFDFDGEVELPSEEILATKGLENVTHWRMAQVPHWLDWDNRDKLHYHTHDDVYRLPRDDDGSLHAALSGIDEKRWRSTALPTFNSFEIESRIGWMQGLSDNFVFSNDDMFLRHEQAVADFVHPILGNVVRAEPGFMVDPKLDPKLKSTSGEWGGLGNAATLIAGRFPSRPREYILHMPKGLSRSIAHEASVMFAQQLTTASTRTFRESTRGRADVEFAWLMTHLQIERWREALLWSFIVARVGGENGEWGPEARDELRAIGLDGRDNSTTIHRRPRATLNDMENIAANAGWEGPLRTTYMHCKLNCLSPNPSVVRRALAGRRLQGQSPHAMFVRLRRVSPAGLLQHQHLPPRRHCLQTHGIQLARMWQLPHRRARVRLGPARPRGVLAPQHHLLTTPQAPSSVGQRRADPAPHADVGRGGLFPRQCGQSPR